MKNKGFSLIELIIVIAIMAVLVAIIAPNLTKYLHASKERTDIRNIDEVRHQTYNCISEATIKEIDVIADSVGASVAYYIVEYDLSTDTVKTAVGSDGVSGFAKILSDSLQDATTASSENKTNDKIKVKISKRMGGGYDVEVSYTS